MFPSGTFPPQQKEAKLAVIPKDKNADDLASSYRQIFLLNVFGKVFERILVSRIECDYEECMLSSAS